MKVRGTRECQECGTRWAYYETGSVDCPACGSIRSVGVDERTEHTATGGELDLTAARTVLKQGRPLREALRAAKERCRGYVLSRGFISAGELRPLDDRFLAAMELRHAADIAGRTRSPAESEEAYVLALLQGADFGERPAPDEVPDSMRAARGLAAAEAVETYLREVRTVLGDVDRPAVRPLLEAVDDHVRRVQALDGDVPVAEADRLVSTMRDIGQALMTDEESGLATARDRLDRLP